MILNSLVNLYETLAEKGKVDKPGWGKIKASYGLEIDANGSPVDIVPLKKYDEKRKKEFPVLMSMPMQVKRSRNIAANFLCDNASYMLGCDDKGSSKENNLRFETAGKLHKHILSNVNSATATAIVNFFDNWCPDRCEEIFDTLECSEKTKLDILKSGANLVLMPLGKFATDYDELKNAWDDYYNSNSSEKSVCMVTGKQLPIAKLHPVIKGIYGAQSMGTSLVSFNGDAFESFAKKQGFNSPISEYAAFAYTTALNYLLSENGYVNHFGDTTVVCWTESDNEGCSNVLSQLLGGDNEISQDDLWQAVRKISQGESVNWNNYEVSPDENFYVLGLSPNAARLSVRFFLQNTFGEFMKNIIKHDEQMMIIIPDFITNKHFSIYKVLKETVNQNSKNKSVKPQLAGDYLYSILTGYKYPETLFYNIMLRIKAERDVNVERQAIRASVIKAYLLRNYPEYKEVLTVKFDKENPNNNLPYNLGRLFSVLEEIQMAANPMVNTTINDKYFTSASSTPAMVFPILIDLAQKHLRKIKGDKPGYCVNKQKELTELFGNIREQLPARMTLQEKGLFQIGYYHQTQVRFSNKEEK